MGNGASASSKPEAAEPAHVLKNSRLTKAPPADAKLRAEIENFAEAVARNGPRFEAMARIAQADNPLFGFLRGGPGAGYYEVRLRAISVPSACPLQSSSA